MEAAMRTAPGKAGGIARLDAEEPAVSWDHPVIRRIWERTEPIPESGCFVWLGALSKGYGRIGVDGRTPRVHKIAYEIFVGPVPDGLELDHLCRVRSCWRPDHLEPVTRAINSARGFYASKTHCVHGHPFNESNTIYRPTGGRWCRVCREASDRKRPLRWKQ